MPSDFKPTANPSAGQAEVDSPVGRSVFRQDTRPAARRIRLQAGLESTMAWEGRVGYEAERPGRGRTRHPIIFTQDARSPRLGCGLSTKNHDGPKDLDRFDALELELDPAWFRVPPASLISLWLERLPPIFTLGAAVHSQQAGL